MPFPAYYTGNLDLDLTKFPVSHLPTTPTFESADDFTRAGFDFMPWVTADCNFSQLSYAPDALFEETAYDALACQAPSAGGERSYFAPPSSLDMTYPKRNEHILGNVAQLSPPGSPITESSHLAATSDDESGPRSSVDSVYHHRTTTQKRPATDSARSGKRRCSQTAASKRKSDSQDHLQDKNVSAPRKPKPAAKSSSNKSKRLSCSSFSSSASSTRSDQKNNHKNQLRTASRKPKQPSTSPASNAAADDDDLNTEEKRARQSHNLVEKQYRNRLNQQFESLLAVLPAGGGRSGAGDVQGKGKNDDGSQRGKGGAAYAGGAAEEEDRRLSKAEVLDMARQRILTLEQECLKLQNDRTELMNNVNQVRHAVARRSLGDTMAV